MTASGTTLGYRKCQKAQSFTFLSLSIYLSPLLLSSLFMPAIGRNLATRRCTLCGICGRERQLHCSAYFIFVRSPIYQQGSACIEEMFVIFVFLKLERLRSFCNIHKDYISYIYMYVYVYAVGNIYNKIELY